MERAQNSGDFHRISATKKDLRPRSVNLFISSALNALRGGSGGGGGGRRVPGEVKNRNFSKFSKKNQKCPKWLKHVVMF